MKTERHVRFCIQDKPQSNYERTMNRTHIEMKTNLNFDLYIIITATTH